MSITLTRYRNLVIRGFVGEPTQSELEAIEQELGTSLPADFIEFLKVANGGGTDFSARVPPPDGVWVSPASLYCTQPDSTGQYSVGTFLGAIMLARQSFAIPRKVLPFADNGGEYDFYLDLTPEGQGRVVVFTGWHPAWTGRPSGPDWVVVADTFVEFIDSLSVEPELAEMMLEDAISEQDEQELAAVKVILDSGLPGWREILGMDV